MTLAPPPSCPGNDVWPMGACLSVQGGSELGGPPTVLLPPLPPGEQAEVSHTHHHPVQLILMGSLSLLTLSLSLSRSLSLSLSLSLSPSLSPSLSLLLPQVSVRLISPAQPGLWQTLWIPTTPTGEIWGKWVGSVDIFKE